MLLSVSSFSQWKSFYPEGKSNKKAQQKVDNKKNKKLYDTQFFAAIIAKSLEDYDDALKHFEKCIEIEPLFPHPYYESAIINADKSSYEIAVEQIKAAVKIDPNNRWYCLFYADILFRKQDFVKAAVQYKKLIYLEPGNKELYFKLADTYVYSNSFRKAILVYDDLESLRGADKTLSMQKHKLYRQLNDMQGAINELTSLLKEFPKDIEVMEILCELYLLNDERDKAFNLFKTIAVIAPKNGRIHLTLADYYRESGENEKSYMELKLAFKSEELNIDTKVRILLSYYQLIALNEDMRNQAYTLAEILIQTHPKNPKARAVFADILYSDNKYQKAKEQYLIVLEKEKSKSQLWTQVLFIQADQNDFEGMLKTSTDALTYFPADPLFYYFNGIASKSFKNYEEAIKSFLIGIEFIVDNKNLLLESHSSLADIYNTLKQHKLSDEYFEKTLVIDTENILALNNYAYYLSLRKINLEKAKEMSFKSNVLAPENATYQDTYAWVLYKLEDYRLAKEWILKALLNGGDKSAVIIEHYGDILYQLGEERAALLQWRKAAEVGLGSSFLNQKIQEEKLYE